MRSTRGCAGLLGPTGPLVAKLRSKLGGQDGLSFAGGEQLLGYILTCGGWTVVDSGEVVAEAEGSGLGGDPGPDAELLCGLWGSEVRQGGVATAAQSLCAAEQGEVAS